MSSTLSKVALALELIESAESNVRSAKQILSEITGKPSSFDVRSMAQDLSAPLATDQGKVIEGVFDGQAMVGSDKNMYPVPSNYASKSKLIPGDVMKLTIRPDGSFLYKQIGPVERRMVMGTLVYEDGKYKVLALGKLYSVLLASVTYFRGEAGDKVTLILPAHGEVDWGAIEAVLPQESYVEEGENFVASLLEEESFTEEPKKKTTRKKKSEEAL
jgi:hypothetical protein